MKARLGVSNAWIPSFSFWHNLLLAGLVSLLGFLLVQTELLQAVFFSITKLLAIVATGVLDIFGYDMVRNGVELRDRVTGHAVAVTAACDGNGLIISAAAVYAFLRSRPEVGRPVYLTVALAMGTILAFNLIRVVALFLTIGTAELMEAQHLYVAPLLSSLLVAVLALDARGLRPGDVVRSPSLWFAVAVASACGWYIVGEHVTCSTVTPVANAILRTVPQSLVQVLSCGSEPVAITRAVMPHDPATPLAVPIYPADFSLATPLVVASLAFGRSALAIVTGGISSLLLFAVATVLGATTAAHDEALVVGARILGETALSESYRAPDDLTLGLFKAAQNVVVHFNLFLLPLILLPKLDAHATKVAGKNGRRGSPRRKGRNGR